MTRRISVPSIGSVLWPLLLLAVFAPGALGQTNVTGQWSVASYTIPINPVHVALLRTGKILVVAGSGNCAPSQSGCPLGPPYGASNSSGALLLDPVAGSITQFSQSWDMFCNSMTILADGRVFINGGTIQYDPFYGQPKSTIFDPSNNSFTDTQNMAHGRWYPTVITLGDGRVLTFSGSNETGVTNTAVEIYTVGTGWSTQYIAPWTPPLYPRMHLLPTGKVFYSGWARASALFDPSTQTWTQNVATTNYGSLRTYGSSVLLALTPANNYDPKVMILGGNSPATATTELIDMGASSPVWVNGPSMSQARIEMDAVMLPNGKVLALGGSANDEDTTTLSLNADLFDLSAVNLDPNHLNVGTSSSAGANASERLYHSVALLLPDATVWLAGGNPARGTFNNTVEIYKPPYLFQSGGTLATRPAISSAPASISYGSPFTVQTTAAASITSVVLVKNGSSTHAFNMDQRLVGMNFTVGSGSLTVTAPPNGNIAPPGYYMLFILNSSGVPSVASMVNLALTAPAVPTNVTATAGSAQVGLSWTASTGATSYNVKRSTTSGGSYTTVSSPTTTGYTDTGLTNGTTYYYVVSAVNGAGESGNSSQVSGTPQTGVPAAPTNVTATAGSAQVTLGWTASSGATSYNVKRSTTSGGSYTTVSSPTTTGYTDTGLTNGTTYYYVVTAVNGSGESGNSSQVSAMPSTGTTAVNYGSGFTAAGLQLNGKATLNGTRLRLTDTTTTTEAGSAFYTTAVNVQNFTTDFSFQLTTPNADGMAFVIQNTGITALGTAGGNLGYTGIGNSVAVKFDLYDNNGEGPDSTGLFTGGTAPFTPALDMTSSGVNLHSGDVFNVHMSYNGTTLTMSITDATTAQTFSTSWTVNIPTAVGGNTALVGFTGGTGGLTALQEILTWTLSNSSGTQTALTPTFGPAPGNYSGSVSVTLSDTTPGAVIHCTTDGVTVPTSSSPVCTTVNVTSTTTIQAMATASGYNNSGVTSGTYAIGASSGAAFVQVNSAVGGAAATSIATAYTALQTAGDLNIVVVGWYDTTASVSSVTDSKGNTYTLAVGPTKNTAGGVTQSIYYAKGITNATAGANTVTVAFSTGAVFPDLQIFEYRGLSTTSTLDATAALSANGGPASSGAATTTTANELIFGAGTSTASFTGPGTGFTQRVISGNGNLGEDMVVTAIGSYSATAPNPNGGYRVMQMATFK